MRKSVKFILICILVMAVALSLVGCANNTGNTGGANANFVEGLAPYEMLKSFVTDYPGRASVQTFDTDLSKDAALWIAEQLKGCGYSSSYNAGTQNEGLKVFTYDNHITGKMETAYNVIFKKESPSDDVVVIGAHYDNLRGITVNNSTIQGDGTYKNAVGVVSLLQTAKAISNIDLPFDVEFVAFGANEFGFYGSKDFVSNHVDKQKIMLMINFDRNAIGDNVYMYSSEAKTQHNEFFYDIAKQNNLAISDLPAYRSPALGQCYSNPYYSNEANWCDSDIFLADGINIINFVSMNFQPFGVSESDGKDNIAFTSDDTFAKVVQRLGGEQTAKQLIDKQIKSAVSCVVYALQDSDFAGVMKASTANNGMEAFADANVATIIAYCLLAAAIIVFVVIYFTLRVSTKSHDVYINTIYGRVNKTTGELVNKPNPTPSGNVGNIFGGEFDSGNGADSAQGNNNSTGGSSGDKTNDIFGDF